MRQLFSVRVLLVLFSVVNTSFSSAQSFTGSFTMITSQAYQSGNTREDVMYFAFGEDKTAMSVEGRGNDPGIVLIFDFPAKTITQLFEMRGEKKGFILPMDEKQWPGMSYATDAPSPAEKSKTTRTGKTKTIEGYTCHEVLASNAEYDFRMWVAPEIPLTMTEILSYQSVGKGESREEVEMMNALAVEGFPLEMELTSKTGKSDVHLVVSDIKTTLSADAFDTTGHELVKIER